MHQDHERSIGHEGSEDKAPESNENENDGNEEHAVVQNRPNIPIPANVPPPLMVPPGPNGMFAPPGLNLPSFPPPVGRCDFFSKF